MHAQLACLAPAYVVTLIAHKHAVVDTGSAAREDVSPEQPWHLQFVIDIVLDSTSAPGKQQPGSFDQDQVCALLSACLQCPASASLNDVNHGRPRPAVILHFVQNFADTPLCELAIHGVTLCGLLQAASAGRLSLMCTVVSIAAELVVHYSLHACKLVLMPATCWADLHLCMPTAALLILLLCAILMAKMPMPQLASLP